MPDLPAGAGADDDVVHVDPPRPPSGDSTARVAEQALARLQAVLDGGLRDRERFDDCFAADFRFESRRRLSPGRGSRERWLRSFRESGDVFGSEQMEVMAFRGDRLVLNLSTSSDGSGFEVAMLNVKEVTPEGRLLRLVFFDGDQMDEALEMLRNWDEQWLDTHG